MEYGDIKEIRGSSRVIKQSGLTSDLENFGFYDGRLGKNVPEKKDRSRSNNPGREVIGKNPVKTTINDAIIYGAASDAQIDSRVAGGDSITAIFLKASYDEIANQNARSARSAGTQLEGGASSVVPP